MKTLVTFMFLLFSSSWMFSQVSVNKEGNPPDGSAMLDVSSNSLGMLVPRMTASERDLISNPATGLLIFCIDDNYFYMNRGTPDSIVWTAIKSQWENNGTVIFYNEGKVGIGTDNPWARLDIRGSNVDEGVIFNIGNSDISHRLTLFGGRQNNPNPYIIWNLSDSLRFITYDGEMYERIRITGNGQVGIGTGNPDQSALLELQSDSKGLLLPRMTTGEIMNILYPADGLQVYNTDDDKLYIYVASAQFWKEISYGTATLPTRAIFSIGSGSDCSNSEVNGEYVEDIQLTVSEYVTIEVTVSNNGYYTIWTDTMNGYSFSDTGIFVANGTQYVNIAGSGTPLADQVDMFTANGSFNGGTCTFTVTVMPCPPGETECSGICVDLLTNEQNCGWCGNHCSIGLTCCNGICVDLNTSINNCGWCGNHCSTGLSCCNGLCVNLKTDVNNCGWCGNHCSTGLTCCNGMCVDLNTDANNCGYCGNKCPPGSSCIDGICVP